MSPIETLEVPQEIAASADGDDGCLCGIPNCQGHEVVDGYAIFHDHPLAPTRVARIRFSPAGSDT